MIGEQERGQPGQLDLDVPGESLKVQRPSGLQPEGHPRCSDDGRPQEAWARVEESRVYHSETEEKVDILGKVVCRSALVYNGATVVEIRWKYCVGEKERGGVVSRWKRQVPMEVGHHDDLQVDEVGEWEIILHKQI